MPVQITRNVDDPADVINLYGAGALLRWERAATSGGVYTEIGTSTISSSVSQYEFFDATGTGTSWYRTRFSNAGNTSQSDYSDPWQPSTLTAYATLDSLREYLELPDNSRDNLLQDLLERASAYIDEQTGRRFYRSPQINGTETRTYNGSTSNYLVEDIVSLAGVEIALGSGGTFTSLASTDWFLDPANPKPGWPYEALYLSDAGSYSHFYEGFGTVRLAGVFGWATVPKLIEQATLDYARELYRQGPGGGGPIGVNAFGTPIFGGGVPRSVTDVVALFKRRTWLVL